MLSRSTISEAQARLSGFEVTDPRADEQRLIIRREQRRIEASALGRASGDVQASTNATGGWSTGADQGTWMS